MTAVLRDRDPLSPLRSLSDDERRRLASQADWQTAWADVERLLTHGAETAEKIAEVVS